jgi:hypothetical protein
MASRSHLNALEARVLDGAVSVLEDLMPEDDTDARDALMRARRDVVASKDPSFKATALVGALVSIVARQQQEIDELREARAPKRAKVSGNAATKS